MQDVLYATVRPVIKFVVNCPKCDRLYDVDSEDFSKANDYSKEYSCYDCDAEFTAVMPGLTRVVEHRDEAVGEGADETPKFLSTED